MNQEVTVKPTSSTEKNERARRAKEKLEQAVVTSIDAKAQALKFRAGKSAS